MLRAFFACLGLALALSLMLAASADAQSQRQRRQQQQQQQQQQPEPAPQLPPTAQPASPPPPASAPAPLPAPAPPPQPIATESSPLPVRIIEPAKTAEQLEQEKQEREDRAVFNSRLLLYSGLLVAAGFLLAAAFLLQSLFLWLALRAMRKSARAFERNAATAQRAFIYIAAITWSQSGSDIKVGATWANSGTTPTRNLRISTNWKASHGELPPDFVFTYIRPPERLFIGPNGRAEVGSVVIPKHDLEAALDGRMQLYFWGRATYEDLFEGSEPHFLEFCYRLDMSGAGPDKFTLTFTHYGAHNRSDEDTHRRRDA